MMKFDFWTKKIIDAASIFSSSIDQRERWTKVSPNASSYEEDMCILFDDCIINLYIEYLKNMNLNENYVKSLSDLINKINDMDSHLESNNKQEMVLQRPEWPLIRTLADKVVANLQTVLKEIPES